MLVFVYAVWVCFLSASLLWSYCLCHYYKKMFSCSFFSIGFVLFRLSSLFGLFYINCWFVLVQQQKYREKALHFKYITAETHTHTRTLTFTLHFIWKETTFYIKTCHKMKNIWKWVKRARRVTHTYKKLMKNYFGHSPLLSFFLLYPFHLAPFRIAISFIHLF